MNKCICYTVIPHEINIPTEIGLCGGVNSYPFAMYDGDLMVGIVQNQGAAITLWNSVEDLVSIGTLSAGSSNLTFMITVNEGQQVPVCIKAAQGILGENGQILIVEDGSNIIG